MCSIFIQFPENLGSQQEKKSVNLNKDLINKKKTKKRYLNFKKNTEKSMFLSGFDKTIHFENFDNFDEFLLKLIDEEFCYFISLYIY